MLSVLHEKRRIPYLTLLLGSIRAQLRSRRVWVRACRSHPFLTVAAYFEIAPSSEELRYRRVWVREVVACKCQFDLEKSPCQCVKVVSETCDKRGPALAVSKVFASG